MRAIRAVLIAACALAATAATAAAQGSSVTLFAFGNGARVIRQTDVAGSVSGQLVVSFHGDPAAGCRALGVCDYSGTVIWNPGGSVDLQLVKLRVHKRIDYEGFAAFGLGPSGETTTARVERTVEGRAIGRCVDAVPQVGGLPGVSVRAGTFTLRLFDQRSSRLATRCAGPRDRDLGGAAPRLTLPVGALLRGRRRVDLRAVRSFAAHGFAGTVSSTLVLRLRKPRNVGTGGGSAVFPPGVKTVKTRIVSEQLSLVRLRGTVTESFRGSRNPDVCALLDSCAAFGTITLHPIPHAPTAQLFAQGPARLPYSDFLVALGLRRGSAPRGITVFGDVSWEDRGTAVERLLAPDTCSDTVSLGDGDVSIGLQSTRAVASYTRFETIGTRCPGPLAGGVSAPPLLSGRLPRKLPNARVFALALSRGSSFGDDGYTGYVRGSLRLTLRRGRVTQQVITEPR